MLSFNTARVMQYREEFSIGRKLFLREQDMKYSNRELNITATTKIDQPERLMRCEKVTVFMNLWEALGREEFHTCRKIVQLEKLLSYRVQIRNLNRNAKVTATACSKL
jgi:hypothetical protein